MARPKKSNATSYVCSQCDAPSPGWAGQCKHCGSWGTVDLRQPTDGDPSSSASSITAGTVVESQPLATYHHAIEPPSPTGVGELDRVLGGGLTAGSVVMLGGEPGIGKSTLTLHAAMEVARRGATTLVVAGEEAPAQIAARGQRLGTIPETVQVIEATTAEDVAATIGQLQPQLVVVDSIQTCRSANHESPPGTVAQLKAVAETFVGAARASGATVLLVGHVTKDGSLAGPKTVEHLVDVVLGFNGDRSGALRYLRAVKNRFGTTNEVGVFQMSSQGLEGVPDPSAVFLRDRPIGVPGSVVAGALDGVRPVFLEIQVLITPSWSLGSGGYRLTVQGLPKRRVEMVCAVMGQHTNVSVTGEVFVSVAGGASGTDPGVDAAVAVALTSAAANQPVAADTLVIGEIGLAGELRSVPQIDLRLQEAHRLGFRRAIVPGSPPRPPTGLRVAAVDTVHGAICQGVPAAQ